jgi:anti-sigma factor RsiW
MSDRFSPQLSAYLDGELDLPSRRRLEVHLAECAECSALLADLRAIVAAAAQYEGTSPSRDLWNAIEARLDEPEVLPIGQRVRRVEGQQRPAPRRFSWPQLIAASLLMTAVGGGAVWLAVHEGKLSGRPTVRLSDQPPVNPSAPVPDSVKTVAFAEQQYDSAVHDLEQLLAAGRSRLDTATVRTVEESLNKIDAAIAEARAAIQHDPANVYLNRQIAANMRRKLNLLRAATNAIAART